MTSAEHRKEQRYPFHWKVAIVFGEAEEQDTFHGVTHDVSLHGCSVLTDHNIFSESPVTVLLSLPAEHPHGRRRVVEVRAQMVYTVLAAGIQQFRCGIQFTRFKGDGRATVKRAITQRVMTLEL